MRNFQHIGGGIYRSEERLGKKTYVYTKVEVYPDAKVVDYLCAWDQAQELWMRYYFRCIDAKPTINKPGTIVLWTNCKPPIMTEKPQIYRIILRKVMRERTEPGLVTFGLILMRFIKLK